MSVHPQVAPQRVRLLAGTTRRLPYAVEFAANLLGHWPKATHGPDGVTILKDQEAVVSVQISIYKVQFGSFQMQMINVTSSQIYTRSETQ